VSTIGLPLVIQPLPPYPQLQIEGETVTACELVSIRQRPERPFLDPVRLNSLPIPSVSGHVLNASKPFPVFPTGLNCSA
jgi:hypothetical protein